MIVLKYDRHKIIALIYMSEVIIINWSAVEEGYRKRMYTTHNALISIRHDFGHICVRVATATNCDLHADSWSISA
jgi:hypothetical protein